MNWIDSNIVGDCNLIINNDRDVNLLDTRRTLIKVIDILGRNVEESRNTPLFYIYDDGKVEKKMIIE